MLVQRRVMSWRRVWKSFQALLAHGLLFSFTLLLALKLDHVVSRSWWSVSFSLTSLLVLSKIGIILWISLMGFSNSSRNWVLTKCSLCWSYKVLIFVCVLVMSKVKVFMALFCFCRFIFTPLWLFHAVIARGRFSLPAPSMPHDRHVRHLLWLIMFYSLFSITL